MTNPLRQAAEPRRKLTPEEICEQGNAQCFGYINEERRKMGLFPVHWVVRNGQAKLESM